MSDMAIFLNFIFLILIVFQIKHFIADYPLQGKFMLGKFKDKGWILPLAAHCAVHGVLTFLIVVGFTDYETAIKLALIDFVIHFTMDRIKASPKLLGRFSALSKADFMMIQRDFERYKPDCDVNREHKRRIKENTLFWWALGFDQLVHHLTHYLIIYVWIFDLV